MVKCGYRGCTREFVSERAVRMHKMRAHAKKGGTKKTKQKRKYTRRKRSGSSAVTMEAISYCCFCGRHLPNAIVS